MGRGNYCSGGLIRIMVPADEIEALVIAVTYGTDEYLRGFLRQCSDRPSSIAVAIVDNSPADLSVWSLMEKDLVGSVIYRSYEDNPGYVGGAQRLLVDLAANARLSFDAIVVTNTDVRFNFVDLSAWLHRLNASCPNRRWVAGPDVREEEGTLPMNPHIRLPPEADAIPASVRRSLRVLSMPYPLAAGYRMLAMMKRRFRRFGQSLSAPRADDDNERVEVYAPYGAFMAFGVGFFEAGADFSGLPLFNEELAIGAIARRLGVPVYYDPSFRVEHVGRATTGSIFSFRRHRLTKPSARFYSDWSAPEPTHLLATCFRDKLDG